MRFLRRGRPQRPANPAPDQHTAPADPVDGIRSWVERSNALDQVLNSDRSAPTANPDTADHLRKRSREISRAEIDAESEARRAELEAHRRQRDALAERERRAVSEGVNDADEAAADLEAIRSFERESSPVTSARMLTSSARRWRSAELGYSLVGAGLSAVGITAMLSSVSSLPLWGAALVAVAVETVTTVRVVDLLNRLAAMREQDRSAEAGAGTGRGENGRTMLILQCAAMLALSVVLNLVGLFTGAGVLGAIGISGALLALFAGLGSQATTAAVAEVVNHNLTAWKGADWDQVRDGLRERASGAHIPELGSRDDTGPDHHGPGAGDHDGEDSALYLLDQMDPGDRAVAAQVLEQDPGLISRALDRMAEDFLDGARIPDDPSALLGPAEGGNDDATSSDADSAEGGNDGGADAPDAPRRYQGGNDDATSNDADSAEGGNDGGADAPTEGGNDDGADAPTEGGNDGGSHLRESAQRRSSEAERDVIAFFAEHPDASTREAAEALGRSRPTIRKYRPAGEDEGGER